MKNFLFLAAIAAGGYFLYKKFYGKATPETKEEMKNFMYATGKPKKRGQQNQDPLVPPIYYARRK